MKRLLAAFFCLSLPLLPARAQTAKPAATPPAATPVATKSAAVPPATVAAPGAKPAASPAVAGARPGAPPARFNGHLSPDPAQFILDVQAMMLASNNAAAKALGEQLRQLWAGGQLTTGQQTTIAVLSQKMLDKKMRPIPHLTAFFGSIVSGKTKMALSEAQLDQYLDVVSQSAEKDPLLALEKYLIASNKLFSNGTVYRSGYNYLHVTGGQLSFTYKGVAAIDPNATFDTPAPAKPEPAAAAKPAITTKPAAGKPVAKAKPKPAVKKRASDGWDTDLWSAPSSSKANKNDGWSSSNDGWGSPAPKKKAAANDGWDDGWGSPAPKKKAPVKSTAKATAKPAAKPVAAKPVVAPKDDFDQPDPASFAPSAAAALEAYYPPSVSGPVIELKDVDMVVGTRGDSVVLHKFNGMLSPSGNRVLATSAQLVWTINNNSVGAEMAGFDFDPSKPEFTAQPVLLSYPFLFEGTVKGALSYKGGTRKPGATESSYPRFISLTSDVKLKNMGPDIKYTGGLSIAGSRMLSAALDGSASRMVVSADGKPRFRATSRLFVLGDSVITSDRAGVSLYEAERDSITHAGMEFKYLKNKQELKLVHEKGMYRNTPFSDSYHQLDIKAQMLVWNLHEPKIEMSVITTPSKVSADFESKNFFSNVRYQQIKAINQMHPIQLLVGYSATHGNVAVMNLRDVADATKVSEENLRTAASGLAREGFVDIMPQTGQVVLTRKAKLWANANRDKRDYDHIDIKSLSGSGRSATLNTTNNQLTVRGVETFTFSNDSSAVKVKPDSGVVRLLRNRNMNFGGRITAAIYGFKGRDFLFDYDGYYIDMPHIDSLTIRSKVKKKAGKADTEHRSSDFTLTNKGNSQSGRLYLNDPTNRSGRKKMPKYPSFTSTSGAYVYFNKPDVLGGAYDSTTYFDVPPFKLDSMGTGKTKGNFVGVFHSKALPPIKTALSTQDDGSLGFEHAVPAAGYPMYGGKGRLSGGAKVKLNAQGLQSNGTVTYLGATLQSDRFVMYGDSVTGVGKAGAIAAGPNFPKVTMPAGFLINWDAARDSLHLQTPPSGTSVKMYADHTFKGSLLLTPKELGGSGRLDGPQSYVRSESMTFKNDSYSGKKGVLSVKSAQAGKPALTANDVDFTYDLKHGYAQFKRVADSKASIDLPYTDFRTSLAGGRWDFKKKRVTFQAGSDSTRSYFSSTKPEQHGLKFKAKSASYDLTKYQLQAKGVPYVAAADAWIVPDSGKVNVAGGGKMQQFHRAKVLLDSLSKFHKLVNGNITVLSRDAFSGDARYMSASATGDSVALKFSNFQSDSSSLLAAAPGRKRGKNRKADAPSDFTAPGAAAPTDSTATPVAAVPAPAVAAAKPARKKGMFGKGKDKGAATEPAPAATAPADSTGAPVVAAVPKKTSRRKAAASDDEAQAGLATTATANVEATQKFQLVPRVGFRGGINLNSRKRGLVFDGQVQLQFGKVRNPATAEWFSVKDSLDPKNLALKLRDLKGEDGTPLRTGLYLSDTDNKVYPLYAGPVASAADVTLFQTDGDLHYEAKRREYTIAAHDLSDANQYEGSVLTYSDSTNTLAFRGPMGFITNNKNYGIAAAGVGKANPDSARYQVQALLGIDMVLPGKATEAMAANLAAVTKNSPEALTGSQEELYNIAQFAGNKAIDVYNSRKPGAAAPALGSLSPKLLHTLTLSKVELRWNAKQKAWYSVGQIGLAGAGKQALNAVVEGYVEIKRENSADVVEVYIEPEPQTWYYFRYANNVLLAKSSNEAFDGEIGGKQKGSIETAIEYGAFLGEFEDVDRFRIHFQRDYQGKSGKLAPRPAAPVSTGNFDGFGADTSKKKKKGKASDPMGDGEITPAADPSADPAATSSKKKKKKSNDPFGDGEITPAAAEPAPEPAKKDKKAAAADPAADPSAEPAPDTSKKKKKGKDAEPAADPSAEPAAEPAPEPSKKKKKAKDNDPFGDGEIAPAVAPAPKPAAPAPVTPAPTPAPVTPAPVAPAPVAAPATPAPADATPATPAPATPAPADAAPATPAPATATPAAEPATPSPATPAPATPVPATPAPAAAPAATEPAADAPTEDTGKKKKKEKVKDAEPAPDPNAEPGTEPESTKKKDKKKKKEADDPFGQ